MKFGLDCMTAVVVCCTYLLFPALQYIQLFFADVHSFSDMPWLSKWEENGNK